MTDPKTHEAAMLGRTLIANPMSEEEAGAGGTPPPEPTVAPIPEPTMLGRTLVQNPMLEEEAGPGSPLGNITEPVYRDPDGPKYRDVFEYESESVVDEWASRAYHRFLGDDLSQKDPIEYWRLGSGVGGSILLGSAVAKYASPLAASPDPYTTFAYGTLVTLAGTGGYVFGSLAPEAGAEILEGLGLLEENYRETHLLSNQDLMTLAKGEFVLDAATLGAFSASRVVFRPLVRKIAGQGTGKLGLHTGADWVAKTFPDMMKLADTAAARDIILMPVQLGNRKFARGFVNVLGRFPFLASYISKGIAKQERTFQKMMEGLPSRMGPVATWGEVSEQILRSAKETTEAINTAFRIRYDTLWARAEAAGVYISPRNTMKAVDAAFEAINKKTPIGADGRLLESGEAFKPILELLNELKKIQFDSGAVAKQSLKQMDGLVESLDMKVLSMEPSQQKFVMNLVTDIRNAALYDVLHNAGGPGADVIVNQMRRIDMDFTKTMQTVFETATAKRFGTVVKRGLRGRALDPTTRHHVADLAKVVVDFKSAKGIDELAQLVDEDTFKLVTGTYMDNALEIAFNKLDDVQTGMGAGLDLQKFAKYLGLRSDTAGKREALDRMLKLSGSNITSKELLDLVDIGRVISDVAAPNVSTFIARRATLGGMKTAARGLMPGVMIGSAAGEAAGQRLLKAAISGIMFVGGTKLFARILADGNASRALVSVMKAETQKARNYAAVFQLLRAGVQAGFDAGMWTREQVAEIETYAGEWMREWQKLEQDGEAPLYRPVE